MLRTTARDRRTGGHIGQVAAHQHNVGGVQCDVRTGTDGNAGLGAGQGGGVVDAVTDHGDAALLLQCADLGFLARGQDARNDMVGVEADSRADVAGRGGVVAGPAPTLAPSCPDPRMAAAEDSFTTSDTPMTPAALPASEK